MDTVPPTVEKKLAKVETHSETPPRVIKERPSFEIDDRIRLYIQYDLAQELAEHITTKGSNNPALWALAKQIENIK